MAALCRDAATIAIRFLRIVLVCWSGSHLQVAAAQSESTPFLRLRDTTLTYHGPDQDFTNLTEIRIGWFGPTNLADPLTGDLWWAAAFAVGEANAARPKPGPNTPEFHRLPVRLVPRWTPDPWGSGIAQFTRMIYEEQPLAALGSVDSASTHLAEQIAAKTQLPLVSPIATDKSTTLAGVSWMFACAPSDDAIARVLVDALPVRGSVSRLALLVATDHESRMTAREVVRERIRRGAPVDFRFDLTPGAVEAEPTWRALTEAQPEAVVIVAGAEDAARWVRGVRERCPAAALFGSQSMGRTRFRELAGSAAEGVRFPVLWATPAFKEEQPCHSAPLNTSFSTRFEAERGHAPDYAAVLTYDATRLLVQAIRQAGPNRTRIRQALANLTPRSGLAGPIHFDGTGQNTRADLRMGTVGDSPLATLKP